MHELSPFGEQEARLIHVASGEVRVGRPGVILGALLGSCVAIALIWPARQRCALAHCLLPEGGPALPHIGARYVDQAVASLLALMKIDDAAACNEGAIEVVVAGGAAMLGRIRIGRGVLGSGVGAANVSAALRQLGAAGLTVTHQDTGGRRGRLIRIDCSTHRFSIRPIDTQESHHAGA